MKQIQVVTIAIAIAALALTATLSGSASADEASESLRVAKQVKLYIAKEHKKRRSSPKEDFEKIADVCGKSRSWTKGCRFWKNKSGKDKFSFQHRKTKKIYGVPSFLLAD